MPNPSSQSGGLNSQRQSSRGAKFLVRPPASGGQLDLEQALDRCSSTGHHGSHLPSVQQDSVKFVVIKDSNIKPPESVLQKDCIDIFLDQRRHSHDLE